MAYLDGVATDRDDFIDQVVSFAVQHGGFTADGTIDLGANPVSGQNYAFGLVRRLVKDGRYFFIYKANTTSGSSEREIRIWFGGLRTPNFTNHTITEDMAPDWAILKLPVNYESGFTGHTFFSDGSATHCVLEYAPQRFRMLSLGVCHKYGAYRGGHYASATNVPGTTGGATGVGWSEPILFDGNSSSARTLFWNPDEYNHGTYLDYYWPYGSGSSMAYQNSGVTTVRSDATGSTQNFYGLLYFACKNGYNGRNVTMPIEFFTRQAMEHRVRPFGHIPTVRFVNVGRIAPGQIIDNNWQVFPACTKLPADVLSRNSGNLGFAFKRV
ncbi:hypothetical protein KPP23_001 [Pseudomonas phage KPP23]|nr:hypothetical protein KPP23_001 [Pseudomonas phage KPP23]